MFRLVLVLAFLPLSRAGLHAQKPSDWDRVRAAYSDGKIYAGLRRAEKQLGGKAGDPAFLVLRAEGRNRLGEFEKAENDARQAMGLVSGDTLKMASVQVGIAMFETGKIDSAQTWLERSLGTGDDSVALIRLAAIHNVRGDAPRAIAALDQVLLKDPAHVKALLERGAAHALAGDTAAARRDLDRAVQLAPRDPVAWNSRGFHVHAAQGRHMEAVHDYDRAIKLDPNYSYAFNNRGWSLYKLGKVDKAVRNIALAGRKRKGNPYVHRNLGVIALETGDTSRACAELRRSIHLNFTQLHGPEVSSLLKEHCGSDDPAQDAPARPARPRGNAPNRSNAP